MKVLAEIIIDGTLYRIGDGSYSLEHKWKNHIVSFPSFCLSLSTGYGGLVEASHSNLTLSPEITLLDYAAIKIMALHGDNEDDAIVVFDGTVHPVEITKEGTVCNLYAPNIDVDIADTTVFSDTLTNCMSTLCGSSNLNLSLDSSQARPTTPAISHTLTADTSALSLLDGFCAWCCHAARKVGSTLHLYDMLAEDAITTLTIHNAKIATSFFTGPTPISRITAGDNIAPGSRSFGSAESVTAYHTDSGEIDDRLEDILSLEEESKASITFALTDGCPVMLERVKFVDTTMKKPLSFTGRVVDVIYDFDAKTASCEAIGEVSA